MTDFNIKDIGISIALSRTFGPKDAPSDQYEVTITNNSKTPLNRCYAGFYIKPPVKGSKRTYSKYSDDVLSGLHQIMPGACFKRYITVPSGYTLIPTHLKVTLANGTEQFRLISGCFVTTAAYGDPHHPMVETFRSYREQFLKKSPLGRDFIDWYYNEGPKIAKIVEKSSALRFAARMLLTPLAVAIRATQQSTAFPSKKDFD